MRGNLTDSAFAILVRELAKHGSVTYGDLLKRHPQFHRDNFATAVFKARKLGIAVDNPGKGKPIVAAGECPCCGRKL
jgi:hypothetical protein